MTYTSSQLKVKLKTAVALHCHYPSVAIREPPVDDVLFPCSQNPYPGREIPSMAIAWEPSKWSEQCKPETPKKVFHVILIQLFLQVSL